ncbi:MAG: hypothetical protein Q27BB25_04515 [Blastomonas sp. CACIA14H2]|uniref:hypothetical protein n=1 Tax=Blastomonas sp. CACIA14H2 TaxID=1419876 RepID=UPI0003D0053A|nr:MAG: hypothetical protein Q27BB25_04515 [Blastomonas sp. CACIA14H2]
MSENLKSTVSLALMAMNQMRLNLTMTKMFADLALGERVNPSDVKDLDAQLGEMASLADEILAELKAAADAR